jgi:hypothetical protein
MAVTSYPCAFESCPHFLQHINKTTTNPTTALTTASTTTIIIIIKELLMTKIILT